MLCSVFGSRPQTERLSACRPFGFGLSRPWRGSWLRTLTTARHRPGCVVVITSSDGFGRLDERLTFKTDDGALIYVQYFGLVELTAAIMDMINGGDTATNFGDQYFFINPRLETGDERTRG